MHYISTDWNFAHATQHSRQNVDCDHQLVLPHEFMPSYAPDWDSFDSAPVRHFMFTSDRVHSSVQISVTSTITCICLSLRNTHHWNREMAVK